MQKYLAFALVVFSLLTINTQAQNRHDDSVKKIAVADARKFKLDKARLAAFRRNRRNLEIAYFYSGGRGTIALSPMEVREGFKTYSRARELVSDYFKPVALAVSDTLLLKDSVYVMAYREKAWQRTRHRRTFGHYVWMTEAVVGGLSLIALMVYLFSAVSHIHSTEF